MRDQGYEVPLEENAPGGSVFDSDIGYHNRYGADENLDHVGGSPPDLSLMANRSPQPSPQPSPQIKQDMGYHNRYFQPPNDG